MFSKLLFVQTSVCASKADSALKDACRRADISVSCVYVWVFIYLGVNGCYKYMSACFYVYVCMGVSVCMSVTRIWVCTGVCGPLHACMYCVFVCVGVCVYSYVGECM